MAIVLMWINAANSLATQFAQLNSESEASQSTDAGATQSYKYVLEAGSTKGKWVPVEAGERPTGQVKVMTQSEANRLNL